ncbi:zinc-ribbon domain-containing protein [Limimaricola sp.]|uniref:zinc-ribbon domain-containing protein n=1 Tax=Limimaricola sp. TaxID=2211665 RepID=UPI00405901A7
MRLTCPNCGAQYEVARDAVPAEGRDVQCSNCSLTWLARPDPEAMAEETARPAPPRSTITPEIAEILRAEAEREAKARRGAGATATPPGQGAAQDAPFGEAPENDPAETGRAEDGEAEEEPVPETEDVPLGAAAPQPAPEVPSEAPREAELAGEAPQDPTAFAAPGAESMDADDRKETDPSLPAPDAVEEEPEPGEEETGEGLGESADPAGTDEPGGRPTAFEPEDDDFEDDPFRDDLDESGPDTPLLASEDREGVTEKEDPFLLEIEEESSEDRPDRAADGIEDLDEESDRDPFWPEADDARGETAFDDPDEAGEDTVSRTDAEDAALSGEAERDAGDADPFGAEAGFDAMDERPFATTGDDDLDPDPFSPEPEEDPSGPRGFAAEDEDADFDAARDDDPFAPGAQAHEADAPDPVSDHAEQFELDDPLASDRAAHESRNDPFIYTPGHDGAGSETEDARAKQRQDEDWADADTDEDWTDPEEDWADLHAAARERAALAAASTGAVTRRDLLPDIEEINSSLRSESMRGQPGGAADTADSQRGRGFRLGFGVALLLAAALALVYSHAGRLGAALPPLAAPLDGYATAIDGMRIALDSWLQSLIDALG